MLQHFLLYILVQQQHVINLNENKFRTYLGHVQLFNSAQIKKDIEALLFHVYQNFPPFF